MAKDKPKVEDIEAIGKSLPKSKETEEFIETVTIGKKGKIVSDKSKKAKSGIKVKTKKDITVDKPMVPPPDRVRVTIPAGEIVYLYPEELDNHCHQPRDMHKMFPPVDPTFTEELKVAGGNLQAILAQREKPGKKPVVIDGHRRVWSLNEINKSLKPTEKLKVKVEIIDVNDAEAAVIAYRLNITAERLTDTERDRWIYEMMTTYGMTSKQVEESTGLTRTSVSHIRTVFEKSPDSVMKALEEGDITTGHAKAMVSLPEKVQDNLVKTAIKRKVKEDPISVREMEQEAKHKRNEESIIERLEGHITTKYIKGQKSPVYLDVDDVDKFRSDMFNNVFPTGVGARYGVFTSGTQEVKRAMTRAGLRLRQKPTPEIEKPKVALCRGCIAYSEHDNACLWTDLYPKVKPHMFVECPQHIEGKPLSQYTVVTCPYCKHPIWDPRLSGQYPTSGNIVVHTEADLSTEHVDPNLKERRVAHAWCFIQQFVKTERLEGVCADCSSDSCDLTSALSRMRSLTDHHEVSKCPLQQKGFELAKVNKAVIDAWTDKRKQILVELKEEEERAKLAESEKAKAKEKSDAKKKADAEAKAKEAKRKKAVEKAKAESIKAKAKKTAAKEKAKPTTKAKEEPK